jgi:phosphoribosylamine---glycine ligase
VAGTPLRVCVVGEGGREHALAVALAPTADVVVCPGNAGMAALGLTCVPRPVESVDAELFVIGPEAPLVDGLADRLRAAGRLVFGPGAAGARLEGSKAWMKEVLTSAGVPTAAYATFDEVGPAVEYLRSCPAPWVIKTDGLAAGKGVLVTSDLDAAIEDATAKLSGAAFGAAGRRVVIEEGLEGPEVSIMAITDGTRACALAAAQDYKRSGDGDTGPNTGGMGAYSPVPEVDAQVVEEVLDLAVRPTLAALQDRNIDYRGVLYAGCMLTSSGPRVLEFNVRFGDPETQVVLPRVQGDLTRVLAASAAGRLDSVAAPEVDQGAAICVVLASSGYPEAPRTGQIINGFMEASQLHGIQLYASGVGKAMDGRSLMTTGGRVLGVGATGPSIGSARDAAYDAVSLLSWEGMSFRRDIAAQAAAVGS